MSDLQKEVADLYLSTYEDKLKELSKKITVINDSDFQREAQKFSIKETALHFFNKYPKTNKDEIWDFIYSAHVARKSGIEVSPEVIAKVISADQSWKKSSGHAFEEMVRDLVMKNLDNKDISILLQREALVKIKLGEIKNDERDLEWLKSQIQSSVFDLFIVGNGYIFGCVQAKTSIRDRVTRDREPSIHAMSRFFWSVVFVLDGDFLKLPKFKAMVNGGNTEFSTNGWHGLYAFSVPEGVDGERIYKLNSETMEPFKGHVIKAYEDWRKQRQWFNPDWIIKK